MTAPAAPTRGPAATGNAASGVVVTSLHRAVAVGEPATVTDDETTVVVLQDGRIRAEWPASGATVAVHRRDVERRCTPLWAIVAAVATLPLFGLGLVFLLIRRPRLTPCTTVTVLVGGLPMVRMEQLGRARAETPLLSSRLALVT